MPDANPFLLMLEHRDSLDDQEREIVRDLSSRRRSFAHHTDIVQEGDRPHESCLILRGLAVRYNLLATGRRQIAAIHVPGEFVDLHSLLLGEMDHGVMALTDCDVALVPHEILRDLSATQPHFTRLLWLLTVIDAAIFRQWLVAAGQLSSAGQIAHFLCDLFTRLDAVRWTDGYRFSLPMSQAELGDAMGLSVVHVNRTLQHLRRNGLIEWQGDTVRILDWPGLCALAEFDPTYLNLRPSPR